MRVGFLLMVICLVLGCATGERVRSIQEGMTKQEVLRIMGNPDGYQRSGEYEALRFTNRLMSGWSWDRADYSVILKDGRVVEYGAGEVRQKNPNVHTLVIVPVR